MPVFHYGWGVTPNHLKKRISGEKQWNVQGHDERFSNDAVEVYGENENEEDMGKYFGVNKRKWRFHDR